ncbi:Wadjet anti-phage system protein JetD domain-containing protein [Streptomyces sp. NPDC002221]|uniref:Wadjet anti-phage system protein JetD domain-containing protein n=1 Tax=Streptomyces sp. NPDC002221 TaxID=3364639 RepID=UPI0036829763
MAVNHRRHWTTPEDVAVRLRKQWDKGIHLTALAEQRPWEPFYVPLSGPKPGDITSDFDAVIAWSRSWATSDTPLRLEYRRVGGRIAGANDIPHRAWIDRPEHLWQLLDVQGDVTQYQHLITSAMATAPQLVPWMTANPNKVLTLASEWPLLLATAGWITGYQGPDLHVRQIDVPGVDTKFIERHRAVLTTLLDISLPAERVNPDAPRANFAARFRFLEKPAYIRFRILDSNSMLSGFSELTVRAAEFTAPPQGITHVYVVENETTYLAFPPISNSMVIHGGGYAVTQLASLSWLCGMRMFYWGDLDTHGFAILNRLRCRFPQAESILMDRSTLVIHRDHWARESVPTQEHLEALSTDESELYQSLVDGEFGQGVRLEQERIRFSVLESALAETRRAYGSPP